jgi:hypothetical protein
VLGAAAAVLVGAAGVAGGFAYGQQAGPAVVAIEQPVQPPAPPVVAPVDALRAEAVDDRTGAGASVVVMPAGGYVRVSATVEGVPPGESCNMVVVSKDGDRKVAFQWITGEGNGEPLTGSALVAPDDVASVDVESEDGRTFVSVPV